MLTLRELIGAGATLSPPGDEGVLEGNCASDSLYFILQAAACGVVIVAIAFATYRLNHVPTGGSREDYGRPWLIGVLLWNITLWSMLPQCVMFVIFHIVFPHCFSGVKQMACLQIIGVPYFSIFIFFQALMILALYWPKQHRDKLGPLVNNDTGLADEANLDDEPHVRSDSGSVQRVVNSSDAAHPTVLMIGTSSRGMFYVDALRRKARNEMRAETFVVDYTDQRGFMLNNAVASGAIARGDEGTLQILRPRRIHKLMIGIPLADESVDKVVMTPFFRQMQPIGDFITPEKDKAPRMAKVFLEAIRVLKPGGALVVVDTAVNVLLAQADMRDLGCENVEFVDTELKAGAVAFMKLPYYMARWRKAGPLKPNVAVAVQEEPASLSMTFTADVTVLDEEVSPLIGDQASKKHQPFLDRSSVRFAFVAGYQITFFIIFMFAAAAAFESLSVPKDIVPGARVSNVFASSALNYPMMCYFTRGVLLNVHHAPDSFALAFAQMVRFDMIAMAGTIVFSLLVWLPHFGLQLSLMHTSLDDDAKSMIGIAISIVLGFLMYKFSRWRSKKELWAARSLPMEHWAKG